MINTQSPILVNYKRRWRENWQLKARNAEKKYKAKAERVESDRRNLLLRDDPFNSSTSPPAEADVELSTAFAAATTSTAATFTATVPGTAHPWIGEVDVIRVEEAPVIPCLDCKIDSLRLKEETKKRLKLKREKREEEEREERGRKGADDKGDQRKESFSSRRKRLVKKHTVASSSQATSITSSAPSPSLTSHRSPPLNSFTSITSLCTPTVSSTTDHVTTIATLAEQNEDGERKEDEDEDEIKRKSEDGFSFVLNEPTLNAFHNYVKTSYWRYDKDKEDLNKRKIRTQNGVTFHEDCWRIVGNSSVV